MLKFDKNWKGRVRFANPVPAAPHKNVPCKLQRQLMKQSCVNPSHPCVNACARHAEVRVIPTRFQMTAQSFHLNSKPVLTHGQYLDYSARSLFHSARSLFHSAVLEMVVTRVEWCV